MKKLMYVKNSFQAALFVLLIIAVVVLVGNVSAENVIGSRIIFWNTIAWIVSLVLMVSVYRLFRDKTKELTKEMDTHFSSYLVGRLGQFSLFESGDTKILDLGGIANQACEEKCDYFNISEKKELDRSLIYYVERIILEMKEVLISTESYTQKRTILFEMESMDTPSLSVYSYQVVNLLVDEYKNAIRKLSKDPEVVEVFYKMAEESMKLHVNESQEKKSIYNAVAKIVGPFELELRLKSLV